jgi:phenylacetate-CoA ligase
MSVRSGDKSEVSPFLLAIVRAKALWNNWHRPSALRRTLTHAGRHSPFYRDRFRSLQIRPKDVHGPAELSQLPFTLPADIVADPFRFLAAPFSQIQHVWETGGTTGPPKMAFYTAGDVRRIRRITRFGMALRGIRQGDIAQICFAFGRPSWPIGSFLQAVLEPMGCLILPAGNEQPVEKQIQTMERFGTTILFSTPSYLRRLTEEGRRICDLRSLPVRLITLGAEPFSEAFRRSVEDTWGAEVFDSYGMIEMGNLIAGECSLHQGMHLDPDQIVEVIDPQSDRPLPPGEEGELVYTTLQREGMPLIRYRSGDIARRIPEPCPCRRFPTARISRIVGRTDQMTFLGTGENVTPGQFDEIMTGIEGVLAYQVVLQRAGYKDRILIRLEAKEPSPALRESVVAALYRQLPFVRHDVEHSQTIDPPEVEFVSALNTERTGQIKCQAFIDLRERAQ